MRAVRRTGVRVGFAGALALVLVWASSAQEVGEAPDDYVSTCATACYEAEERCYERCDDAEDPAVCEDECRARADTCLDACEQ